MFEFDLLLSIENGHHKKFNIEENSAFGRREGAETKIWNKLKYIKVGTKLLPVLRIRIRIHRIHMFLGLPDPDPLVRGMDRDPDPLLDPDPYPSIIMQK
jgi:hypothetical protein